MRNGDQLAQSVLECGSPLPLSVATDRYAYNQSGRGLPHSKTWRTFGAALVILGLVFCASAQAQYSVDWYKISGGGGTSTGGVYSATGTIGQPDAGGPMTGGNYSVTGGFWGLVAVVQTPGAPTLSITVNRPLTSITVSWPYPSTGFTLQQNSSLSTTNWTASGFTVSTNASVNSITITQPTGNLFFRLVK